MKTYFAYGSDLCRQQMQSRCPRHRLLGAGILMGYRIIITARGDVSVVPSPADLVFGTVYTITELDEERLDLFEGVQEGLCRKEIVEVETERGTVACLVYLEPTQEEGTPRKEYAERIRRGIADARLPSLYVDRYLWQMTVS